MLKICVDVDKCAGLGMCESWAPDRFEVQSDAKVHVLAENIDESQRDAVQGAIDNCPTGALSIE
ncbi:ferredoxin [Streptomyces sp. NPDC005708]|uniref:ferredoxin n=1 Tax=Streptomyces sp. NPDC005708 TaxID=3154564 RepID=UPI0033DDD6FB